MGRRGKLGRQSKKCPLVLGDLREPVQNKWRGQLGYYMPPLLSHLLSALSLGRHYSPHWWPSAVKEIQQAMPC